MTATANAAAVKAAATLTRRIAGRAEAYVRGNVGSITLTRTNVADAVTASATVEVDGVIRGGGTLPEDVVARIAAARGGLQVEADADGVIRFSAGGVMLGSTVGSATVAEPMQADPRRYLLDPAAIRVEADYYGQADGAGRRAAEDLQGVAEAAASGRDARAVLTAIALDADGAAATDTYRLHVAELQGVEVGPDVQPRAEVLIPAYVITAIPAAKVRGFRVGGIPAGIGSGRFGMVARLDYGTARNRVEVLVHVEGPTVAGPYPNWRTLMPDAATAATAGSYVIPDGMAEAVRTLRRSGPVVVGWDDRSNVVEVAVADQPPYGSGPITVPEDAATAALGTATTGTAEVTLNAAYLHDAARFAGVGATVGVRDGLKAIRFGGTTRTALLMPMRAGR
jgi:hypothetical protein